MNEIDRAEVAIITIMACRIIAKVLILAHAGETSSQEEKTIVIDVMKDTTASLTELLSSQKWTMEHRLIVS